MRPITALLVSACLALPAFAAEPKPKPPLTFGMGEPYGPEHSQKAKAALEPYLTKALGSAVTVQVFSSSDELKDALADGKIDFAWITPLAFVQAVQKNPDVTAVSKAMRAGGGSLFYRSVFIMKKDATAASVMDLKGKKVAWVSKGSTSGYLFPRELVRQAGGDPATFFASETFAGDHPSVCKAVRDGAAEVGATFATDAEVLKADGCTDAGPIDDFKVVASSGKIPNEVIALRPYFAENRVNDIMATFGRMTISPEGKTLLKDVFRADGWGAAVDGDFDPVLELFKMKDAKPKTAGGKDAKGAKRDAPAPKKKGSK